ncbi:MAG TPA: sigma-70 family RNA polymerase sigma factor [Acidimicrobiales bacterium]|nr:sigma-70 family RNA polymerase sigma factor [Acidimicrobiales bacterium]
MVDTSQPDPRPSWSRHESPPEQVSHLRLVEGETYADWNAAYLDNVGRLYRLMYSRVGNRPDAEDLTSEVFRAAFVPMRIDSSKAEVRAYLVATARTVLAVHWRRRLGLSVTSIDPETDVAYLDDDQQPDDGGVAHDWAVRILAALPERYRRILELRFLEMCSVKEAARAMDVSTSNAKVLQHRALKMAAKVAEAMS